MQWHVCLKLVFSHVVPCPSLNRVFADSQTNVHPRNSRHAAEALDVGSASSGKRWADGALADFRASCHLTLPRVRTLSLAVDGGRIGAPAKELLFGLTWDPVTSFAAVLPPADQKQIQHARTQVYCVRAYSFLSKRSLLRAPPGPVAAPANSSFMLAT